MRLATARLDGGTTAVRIDEDTAVVLPFTDVAAALGSTGWHADLAAWSGRELDIRTLDLAPVIPQPEKILCVGLNYPSHASETNHELLPNPPLFAKYWRALVGPHDEILLPDCSERVDWEAELAIVIGRSVRNVSESVAHDAIAGYAVANDVTMRDWQRRTTQYLQGKTFESTTPLGPWLVTSDELEIRDGLRLTCEIDGELVQDALTSEMVFGPAQLVAYISKIITLVPGDVVLTGTPAGIGARRIPPRFLQPGTVLRTAVEGIGEVVNLCAAAPESVA